MMKIDAKKKRFISVRIYYGMVCLIPNQIRFVRLRKRKMFLKDEDIYKLTDVYNHVIEHFS